MKPGQALDKLRDKGEVEQAWQHGAMYSFELVLQALVGLVAENDRLSKRLEKLEPKRTPRKK